MMLIPKNLKPHFPAGEMGLKFTEYSVQRSAKFDADTVRVIRCVILVNLFTPFYDAAVIIRTGFKGRIVQFEFDPGIPPESKLSFKVHAVAAHIVYFAV